MAPTICTIQGNIAVGKSTLVSQLKTRLENRGKRVCYLQEPVSIWDTITDENGKPILALYYEDQHAYAFAFQMMAYISRLSIVRKALDEDYDLIIAERSLATDKNIFAKMLFDEGKIKHVEHEIYQKWCDEFQMGFPKERIVYLRSSPEVAHHRVNVRGREGESIPLEYLQNCHKYHEDWLAEADGVLTIDGNVDLTETPTYVDERVKMIEKFIFNEQE